MNNRLLLLLCCLLFFCGSCGRATSPEAGSPVRAADVETPGEGCVFIEAEGCFEDPEKEVFIGRLNEIRLEACTEGIMNPSTGEPLTEKDYVPLVWSSDLERIAQLRAAEASVLEDHVRPNGKDCFSVAYGGEQANYETLAWGYPDLMHALEGWYSEKAAYTGETGEVCSHYIALITPGLRTAGAAAFTPSAGERSAFCAEFGMQESTGDAPEGEYGVFRQRIEVLQQDG